MVPRVVARSVTTARFVTKVTKRAAMPARFVTNEVMTNRAGIALFFLSLGYHFVPLLRTLNSLIDWFITSFFTFVIHLLYRLFACLLCYSFTHLFVY